MNVTKTTAPVVAVTATTITLAGLDAGQVRRFVRIMEAQALGESYTGALTTEFARQVVAQLG